MSLPSTLIVYFGIEGHASLERRFFMNHIYGGCDLDEGWFVAVDRASASGCSYEVTADFPVLEFARHGHMARWGTGDVGRAESFSVFVKYQDTGPGSVVG